ncbi:MAG: nucleoside deaminase [Desulfobacterales bacterium]|nr:nucleoside deaminase [Desulfobacterales bacterium]MCP4158833.1 nucleoside deaminase [Deltaproteobacteria bacterium]
MDHDLYMKKALELAEKALNNGEFPVGAIIVHDGKIITESERLNSFDETAHAEMNALSSFYKSEITDRKSVTIYSTLEPCMMCYGAILISGIGNLVYGYEDAMGGGTSADLTKMPVLYSESSLNITKDVLRAESLNLFKEFFKNPANKYWKNSYLESYTLKQ